MFIFLFLFWKWISLVTIETDWDDNYFIVFEEHVSVAFDFSF